MSQERTPLELFDPPEDQVRKDVENMFDATGSNSLPAVLTLFVLAVKGYDSPATFKSDPESFDIFTANDLIDAMKVTVRHTFNGFNGNPEVVTATVTIPVKTPYTARLSLRKDNIPPAAGNDSFANF